MRDKVHALGVSSIQIKSIRQTIYHVGLYKDKYKRLYANGDWPKFISDHGLRVGNELFFFFQKNEPHLVLQYIAQKK